MRRAGFTWALAAALLAGPAAALAADAGGDGAQGRPFCADRPGKATPPCILDAGRVQIESGLVDFARSTGGPATDDVYAIGATELRAGLTRRTELEASWTPWTIDRTRVRGGQSSQVGGTGDLTLGLRTAITDPDGSGVAVSAQGWVVAPTATHGLGQGGWGAGFRAPASAPLPAGFSLGLAPEVDLLPDTLRSGSHPAWSGAVALSHALGPASLGVELWAQRDEDPGARVSRASVDLTSDFMVGRDLQLDAGANLGLNRATPDVELYVGVARRF